jgi:hypothetical protein
MIVLEMMQALGMLLVGPPESLSRNDFGELEPAEKAPDADMTDKDELKVEIVVETA